MSSSCFSLVSLYGAFMRRCLTAAGLSSQTVEIDGDTTIHFWGPPAVTRKPKLVLIQGFGPESMYQWRTQVSFFAGEFDVYMPDLVFFGDSYSESPERSEFFQATCLAKLLQKIGVPRYSLVGTSYGGMVAYRMASMWPERVDKVVIASSAVNLRRRDNEELLKKVKEKKIEDLMLPCDASGLRKLLQLVMYKYNTTPYLPHFVLNDFMKLYSENRKEKLELLKGLTVGQDDTVNISPLSQQVLIVWGECDQIFLLDKAKELKKLMGENARLEVIEKSGHVPQLEQAAHFNKIVKNFLY